MEYLTILLLFFASALFIEKKYHIHLYNSRNERIIITAIFFIIGVAWDSWAIYRNHWIFIDSNLIGVKIGLMPLEEYLFMLILPFCILTYYKLLVRKIK